MRERKRRGDNKREWEKTTGEDKAEVMERRRGRWFGNLQLMLLTRTRRCLQKHEGRQETNSRMMTVSTYMEVMDGLT